MCCGLTAGPHVLPLRSEFSNPSFERLRMQEATRAGSKAADHNGPAEGGGRRTGAAAIVRHRPGCSGGVWKRERFREDSR